MSSDKNELPNTKESALEQAKEFEVSENLLKILNAVPAPIFIKNENHRLVFMNDAHCELIKGTRKEMLGKNDRDLFSEEEANVFIEMDNKVLTSGIENINEETICDSNDNVSTKSTKKTLLIDSQGRRYVLGIVHDVTDRKLREYYLENLSLTDDLTGLYNRRGLSAATGELIKTAIRQKKPALCIFADIDGLKVVNDKFGHEEGDRLIIAAARIIEECFRDSDACGRIGGDEFVVYAQEVEEGEVAGMMNKIKDCLVKFNKSDLLQSPLSLSLGYSCLDPDYPVSMETLIDKADKGMYREKKRRKKNLQ